MNKLNLQNLLDTLKPASRSTLAQVIEDANVHYLLVFEPPARDRKKVIPAGPGLDFRGPNDARNRVIDGQRMTGYVDLAEHRSRASDTEPNHRMPAEETGASTKIKALESKISWLKGENQELKNRFSEARRQLKLKNELIKDLKRLESVTRAKLEEYQLPESEQNSDGYGDLAQAEEELIGKMNEYMVKEAELEQREENLLARERRFSNDSPQSTRRI